MSKRKDWQAQINWAIAPPEATHFAIDFFGWGVFYKQIEGKEIHCPADWHGLEPICKHGSFKDFDFGNYADTLIERPEPHQEKPIERGDIVTVINNGCVGKVIDASKKSVWISFYGSNHYEFEWHKVRHSTQQESENYTNAPNLNLNLGDVVVCQSGGLMGEVLVSDKYEAMVKMNDTHIKFKKSEIRLANEEEKRDYYAKKGIKKSKPKPFKVGDIVIHSQMGILGTVVKIDDKESCWVQSMEYTGYLKAKGYSFEESDTYCFYNTALAVPTDAAKIAYRKATINAALSNPIEEVIQEMKNDAEISQLLKDSECVDEKELKAIQKQARERLKMKKRLYFELIAKGERHNIINQVQELTDAFFEKFGYENG